MKWSEVREQFPDCWVLVEAISAVSRDSKRTIEEMSVLDNFEETMDAWKSYKHYHLADPNREFYIFYTGNEYLEVLEQPFIGIRGLQ
jgi:hypothetical protein